MSEMARPLIFLASLIFASAASGGTPGSIDLQVERTVLLMRHGVRAPLSEPAMPAGTAVSPWQKWSVPRAHLTSHGRVAVRWLGVADRSTIGKDLPSGCPAPGSVIVVADNDQRTIETGRAWSEGFAPDCPILQLARPAGEADPIFAPLEAGASAYDGDVARLAVEERLPAGGTREIDARNQQLYSLLDSILCGLDEPAGCGIGHVQTQLQPVHRGREPAITGALANGAKAAQILTLEYAEGIAKPGWGRLTPNDVEMLGSLRAQNYEIVLRTPVVSRAFGGPTLSRMIAGIDSPNGPDVTLLVGHDSNIAAVAGLLDLHWKIPGFAADDPPPSGAIGLQLLRDQNGDRLVRMFFRSPNLEQIRNGGELVAPSTSIHPMAIPACRPTPFACPVERFRQIVDQAIRP